MGDADGACAAAVARLRRLDKALLFGYKSVRGLPPPELPQVIERHGDEPHHEVQRDEQGSIDPLDRTAVVAQALP